MRVKQWISLFLCVIILLPGCAASEEKKTEREIFAMDTIMNLTFYRTERNIQFFSDGGGSFRNSAVGENFVRYQSRQ